MALSDDRLLAFYKRSYDTIRTVLKGLDEKALHDAEPVRGKSLASEAAHIIEVERFWLDSLQIEPSFDKVDPASATVKVLLEGLDQAEKQYSDVLSKAEEIRKKHTDDPANQPVQWNVLRVGLHALYHLSRMIDLRIRNDKDFKLPPWDKAGSWDKPVSILGNSLFGCGDEFE